jgi:geranylgeranyl pyrophosphate synthase
VTGGPETPAEGGRVETDLKAFLARERAKVEEALQQALLDLTPGLPQAFRDPVHHGVTSGGKRLRPILCVAAYRAAGGEGDGIYPLAVSLELIHAYSLMHDDLPCMDDADLRRGEPTTHKIHGEHATAVAGALLIPLAALQAWKSARALGLPEETCRALLQELVQAAGAGGMVGGQVLDLMGEDRELAAAELDDLHSRKTGALLRAALRMGGIAAGAEAGRLEALDRYGAAIGLAFQIADDLLDATSSAQDLGKEPSDADLGKSTYVALFGIPEASRRARAQVDGAVRALRGGGIRAPELEALARYIVERKR